MSTSSPTIMPHRPSIPLWPLALLAGALPALAALVAWGLSIRFALAPECNPFIDGCVSISRAARHGLPNHVFRAIVLPAAGLQAVLWVLAARWLHGARGARWLAPMGVTAAVALALYGSFLGTEGAAYRFLRHWGTVGYFGLTCLNMLIVGNAIARQATQPNWLRHGLHVLLGLLVLLGLANAALGPLLDAAAQDRVENVTEWWGALVMTLLFFALALIWRREGVHVELRSAGV